MNPTLLNVLYAILIACATLITIFTCLALLNFILFIRKVKKITRDVGDKLNFIDDVTESIRQKLSDSGLYIYLGKKIYQKVFQLFQDFKAGKTSSNTGTSQNSSPNTKKKTTTSRTKKQSS